MVICQFGRGVSFVLQMMYVKQTNQSEDNNKRQDNKDSETSTKCQNIPVSHKKARNSSISKRKRFRHIQSLYN